jgi:predicted DNA-binding transcriptional regulator YafY
VTDELESRGLAAKHDRLARFNNVIRFLAEHRDGATPDQIAAFTGVSRRTSYRDLTAIEREMGIPLWSGEGRWGLASEALLPALRLTRDEGVAWFLAARLMAQFADHYDPATGSAFQKLAEALPQAVGEHLGATIDVLAARRPDEAETRNLRELSKAWAERRIVELTYDTSAYAPGRPPRRTRVRPYLIEPSSSTRSLYLIGWDEERGAVRTFKLQRILDLSVTPERFPAPDDGAVQAAQAFAWGVIADQEEVEVSLRFDASVQAQVTETTWHPTETRTVEPDGSVTWTGRVPGTVEISRWILGFGSKVEVLAPASLRDEIAATLRAAAARY